MCARMCVSVCMCVRACWERGGAHPVAPPRLWQVGSQLLREPAPTHRTTWSPGQQQALSQVLKRGVCWGRGLCDKWPLCSG